LTINFVPDGTVAQDVYDDRTLEWLSAPAMTGCESLTAIRIELPAGGGHTFHRHPEQEEFLYVIEGSVELWVEDESRTLGAGDACFVPRNVVHASFNDSPDRVLMLAILGPSVGETGATMVEVGDEEPWASLR